MTEEKIENELNCTVCLDIFTDPKILQCFHVFCQKCLVKLVMKDLQGQHSLLCPVCRQVTPVPAKGTAGLPSAFRVNRLLEILDQHKKAKGEAASAEIVDSKAESFPSALCCSEHDGREVELFCETCGELICYRCAIKGGTHHSHDYKDINESFERYKEEVAPALEPLEKKLKALSTVLTQLDRHCDEITHQRGIVESEIRESSKQLHDIISNRQDKLISQLDQITGRKLKSLATQRNQIETLQAQLSVCLEFARESLKTDVEQREVLVMKTSILKQVQELATPSKTGLFIFNTEANVVFSDSANTSAVCERYGKVYELDLPDPSKCVATGRGIEEAVVGEKATAALEAIAFKGEPCSEASVSTFFQVELVSEITGDKVFGSVECSMEQTGQGQQYMISYQPTVKERHQLHIKADNEHVRGSPFHITVSLPVEKLGTSVLALQNLGDPWGVAVNRKGKVIVAEFNAHLVSVFSPSGEKIHSFGMHGCGEGRYSCPSDVTVDGEGNLLVLDWNNHCIQKFTEDGYFVNAVGSKGNGPLQFMLPTSITYSASNNKIYVADVDNHRIQVLAPNLSFVTKFGRKGNGKGQFNSPYGVATDGSGRVYVADCKNFRIQVFTAEGKFLKMFGRKGFGYGNLNCPWGVGVDANGLVYVSENLNHRVSVFTSEGRFVTAFGSYGKGSGQFRSPCGLSVDKSGVVYLCDSGNHRVLYF